MARSWNRVRADVAKAGLIDEQRARNARKDMHETVRAYRLADVRKTQGPNQVEVATAMGVSQARVSKLENGDLSHTELGTLESYVEALGGELRVVADFGDTSVALH